MRDRIVIGRANEKGYVPGVRVDPARENCVACGLFTRPQDLNNQILEGGEPIKAATGDPAVRRPKAVRYNTMEAMLDSPSTACEMSIGYCTYDTALTLSV